MVKPHKGKVIGKKQEGNIYKGKKSYTSFNENATRPPMKWKSRFLGIRSASSSAVSRPEWSLDKPRAAAWRCLLALDEMSPPWSQVSFPPGSFLSAFSKLETWPRQSPKKEALGSPSSFTWLIGTPQIYPLGLDTLLWQHCSQGTGQLVPHFLLCSGQPSTGKAPLTCTQLT